eukprot:gene15448-biopygen6677
MIRNPMVGKNVGTTVACRSVACGCSRCTKRYTVDTSPDITTPPSGAPRRRRHALQPAGRRERAAQGAWRRCGAPRAHAHARARARARSRFSPRRVHGTPHQSSLWQC